MSGRKEKCYLIPAKEGLGFIKGNYIHEYSDFTKATDASGGVLASSATSCAISGQSHQEVYTQPESAQDRQETSILSHGTQVYKSLIKVRAEKKPTGKTLAALQDLFAAAYKHMAATQKRKRRPHAR